jgi:hypothetical protein
VLPSAIDDAVKKLASSLQDSGRPLREFVAIA